MSNDAQFIRIEGLSKHFGEFAAVDNVSLDIARGELFAILGASGCGKTTLLRMLAGFENPSAGAVLIDGNLTEAILERARAREPESIKARRIEEISTDQLDLRAERPRFSVLDCTALRETFSVALPNWKDQLDLCLDA